MSRFHGLAHYSRSIALFALFTILCLTTATLQAAARQSRGDFTDVKSLPDGAVGERISELLEVLGTNDMILGYGRSSWFVAVQIRNQQVGGSNPLAGSSIVSSMAMKVVPSASSIS